MGINKPFTRLYVLNPSTPLTSGGTRDLGDGQIGLFTQKAGARGAIATSSIVNKKNEKFFFEVGQGYQSNNGGFTTRGFRGTAFNASDVEDLSFNESLAPTLAQIYLGYDGKDSSKSIALKKGASAEISLKLTGLPLTYYGYSNGIYETSFVISADALEDCEDDCTDASVRTIVLNLIKNIKNQNIRSGVKISDVIDVHPVFSVSPNAAATGTTKFYTLSVCDAGDSQALGLVQAQAAGYDVTRIKYEGNTSTYQVVGASAPSDFASWTNTILTECGADCPDGYTATGAGFLYTISLNTAAGIEAALEGKAYIDVAVKTGQEHGVDKWTILCPAVLTAANIANLISTYPTVQIDGAFEEVSSVCVIDDATETAWVLDETCNVSTKRYFIELDDTLCGDSRSAELVAAFPQYTVFQLGEITTVTTPVAGTFTNGTYSAVSGTTDGTGTGATFNVTVTGGNSAAITVVAKGDGYKVGDTITILDADLGDAGADDLEIVVASITDPSAGDCRQRYYIDVITSAVCDECHPDIYVSEEPAPFEFERWQEVPEVVSEEGYVGIMFRSKKLDLCPPKHFADKIGMINNVVEIQVSGGWLLGTKIGYKYNTAGEFAQTRVSRAFDGTGWGRDYRELEQMTAEYSIGVLGTNDEAEKWFKNIQSKLEPCSQYDTISLKLSRTVSAQGFSKQYVEKFRNIFVIPKGSKYLYESFFNLIASANNDVSNI